MAHFEWQGCRIHNINLSQRTAGSLGPAWASQVVLVVKNTSANAGNIRDLSLIPGSGRASGEGHGSPLQYSCLENPLDRGTWWATVHRVAESDTTEVT